MGRGRALPGNQLRSKTLARRLPCWWCSDAKLCALVGIALRQRAKREDSASLAFPDDRVRDDEALPYCSQDNIVVAQRLAGGVRTIQIFRSTEPGVADDLLLWCASR